MSPQAPSLARADHSLEASVVVIDSGAAVAVRGELDIATRTSFDAALSLAIERGGSAVVVDLTDLSFIDASGLGALASARNRLSADARALAVGNPSPLLGCMMAVTGLTDLLDGRCETAVDGA